MNVIESFNLKPENNTLNTRFIKLELEFKNEMSNIHSVLYVQTTGARAMEFEKFAWKLSRTLATNFIFLIYRVATEFDCEHMQ